MNIKEKINKSGLYQWEVAERLKVSEFTFSRWMRRPDQLSKDKIDLINKAIEELSKERKMI